MNRCVGMPTSIRSPDSPIAATFFSPGLRQVLEGESAIDGSLLLIRLTDLAGINRRLGREATDDYLKRAADAIRLCARLAPEGIAARLNGADFAVMLPG